MISVSVCVCVCAELFHFFYLPLVSPPFQALRNAGLMSVRVRYRLTNYHCPSSLHSSLAPSLCLFSPSSPSPPALSSTLRPCRLPLCSPVSRCCVYTCCRDWSRGEDKQRGSESGSEKTPKGEEKLWLVLSGCVSVWSWSPEICSHCAFCGGPVTEDRSLLDNQHEASSEPDGQRRGGGEEKEREDEKVTSWIVAFCVVEEEPTATQQLHVPSSHRLAGNSSHEFSTLLLLLLLLCFSLLIPNEYTVFSHLDGSYYTHTNTHMHTHSGYLEGHFFSWSSDHTDPADCCNLHGKVTGRGLDVYLCVCVFVWLCVFN